MSTHDATYEQTLEDYERLLRDPPERRRLLYESFDVYRELTVASSQLDVARIDELLEHGFEPVVSQESTVHQSHPLLAAFPPDELDIEIWSHPSGLVAELLRGAGSRLFLSVAFSDATQLCVGPPGGMHLENPARTQVVSSGSLAEDVALMLEEIDRRHRDGVRVLRVVDEETARLSGAVDAAYLRSEMPVASDALLDSTMQSLESARRTELWVLASALAFCCVLGLVFSSWLVLGVSLLVACGALWMLDRWLDGMVDVPR